MPDVSQEQILAAHRAAIEGIKNDLLEKAGQQIDSGVDDFLTDLALTEEARGNIETIRQRVRAGILGDYRLAISEMADAHLAGPQTKELVAGSQKKLQSALVATKDGLHSDFGSQLTGADRVKYDQAWDKISKQLVRSLTSFSASQIIARKAQLLSHNAQLLEKGKKTDANLTAGVFDPKTSSTDPKISVDYGYKVDIDNLRLQIKHALASLKPEEKLHIEVEVPPDRVDILKRVAENSFQYRIPLVALLLMWFIELKMINKDDETRVVKAVAKLAKQDGLMLNSEDIMFSIKARGSDGKLQTLQGPRPLDASLAWQLSKGMRMLHDFLYPSRKPEKPEQDYAQEQEAENEPQHNSAPGITR